MVIQDSGGIEVDRGKIPGFFTEESERLMTLFFDNLDFGLPFSGGFYEQPCHVSDVLRALKNAQHVREASKKRRTNGKRPS